MDPYRLPDTVVPGRYELTLRPDLDAAVFTGEVRIHVRLRRGVEEIWLNAAELDIFRADCHVDGQKLATRIHLDGETERCCLRPERAVGPGDAILHLCFRGTLNDQLRGFYRCRYRSADGASRWLAATQFEATDARRAFPCWDEPAFKAVFSTTLVIPAHLQAISNSRLLSEQRE
ncbi:MAG: M1 family peptidase, partial [Gemmataceae bacterium]